MKKMLSMLLLLVWGCLAIGASSLDNRYALVVGNSKYQENALRNPVNDATLVADTLKECGFEVNYAYDVDGQSIRSAVAQFAQKVNADPKAVAMLYYSGHGLQIDGTNYLVPVDNRSITNETTAKALSYRLDDYLETVKAPTQIIVLDACRNNPYTAVGARAASVKGGLATIKGRKGTSLSYLYSTQAGETADDGTGINSLFTTILVEEIGKTNVELTSVFNSVNNRVKEMTQGKQVPLNSGTGTNFYFMTPELADREIARWEAELKKAKDALLANSALSGRQTTIEQETAKASAEAAQRLAQAELTAAQALKERVTREAKALEEEKLAKTARTRAQQQKIDAIKASAEAAATQVRLQRNKDANAQGQVNFIEAQKLELKKIKDSQQSVIQAYERDAKTEMERKIKDVQDRPFQKAELGSDGYPTANALLMRKRIIENIQGQYSGIGDEFSQKAYQSVAGQLSKISDSVKTAVKTLEETVFTESSIMNELRVTLSNFDGEKAGWWLTFHSQITRTDGKPVFSGTLFLPYESLTGLKNNQLTGDLDAYFEYLDQVDMYDSLFRASTPIITGELTYSIKASAGTTVYTINLIKGVIKRSDSGKVIITFSPDGKVLAPVSIIPTPVIDIRTPEELASSVKSTLTFTNWWGDTHTITVPKGNPVSLPDFIPSAKFVQVAAGNYHSLALREDGVLFSTGSNNKGQLGNGSKSSTTTWKRVLTDVKQISAGENHSLALLSDGAVYATGFNEFGQLGIGSRIDSLKFVPVLTEVREIAGGGNMSFMVKKDNTLWACGENKYG
ncbi:MAG TPA: caspase family protein, partial [Sphaerochaeta sp.]|nr:caspase family protein [Sphaerochaeta sp.]